MPFQAFFFGLPLKKGKSWYYSLIILGAWSIWNHRNRCVFDGIQPSLNRVLAVVKGELHLWSLARAQGVSHLLVLEAANG
jgi:hypothetical protein